MATSRNNNGCLAAAVTSFPRVFLILAWIARPGMMDLVFRSFLIPCLGFFFVPWTTLMYLLLYTNGLGISGLDWVWLALTLLMDVAMLGTSAATNRDRLPTGVPGSTQSPAA